MADHYTTLGVDPSADFEEIRAAHRAAMRQVHPDVAGAGPRTTARAAMVNEAWAVLKDPRRRAAYDRARSREVSSSHEAGNGSRRTDAPSWGPGGLRPVTVEQLREAAAREQAYGEVGRRHREAFSEASWRIGLRIVTVGAALLALVVAVVASGA
ncbi:J domain-containing protein [Euzebya tangerina]|uniref:J domain-containing protein n=1 Tax=Euzebya tangerina TaxID=591198 RepID=UPI0013C3325A|nr:J domain-containing protein [Euzebya tangerina]